MIPPLPFLPRLLPSSLCCYHHQLPPTTTTRPAPPPLTPLSTPPCISESRHTPLVVLVGPDPCPRLLLNLTTCLLPACPPPLNQLHSQQPFSSPLPRSYFISCCSLSSSHLRIFIFKKTKNLKNTPLPPKKKSPRSRRSFIRGTPQQP